MSTARGKQLLLTAMIVVTALLCTFSAGNRLAELPGHAQSRLSPFWFGAGNAQQRAFSDIDQRDFAGALRWSSIAVARNPVGQHSTSLLGLSLLGTGQAAAAQRAYTVAATGGWRDVGVQTYWMMAALGVGDDEVAAERLDALLRAGNQDPQTIDGLTTLEATPSGRRALVDRLRLSPDWTQWYVRSLRDLHDDALTGRLAVIAGAFHRGLPLDRRDIAGTATALRLNGEIKAAAWLWTHLGGGKDTGLTVADGTFDTASKDFPMGPFDWTLLETGAVDARIDSDSPLHSGAALYALSAATTTRRIAQQALILPPGSYAVRWNSADSTGARSSDIDVRVLCSGSAPNAAQGESEPMGRNGSIFEFTVPATGCRSQIVAIEIHPNIGMSRSPVWTDDVSVARVSATD